MPKAQPTLGERMRALVTQATEGTVPPRDVRDAIEAMAEELDTLERVARETDAGLIEQEERAIKAESALEEAKERIATLERIAEIACELMEGLDDPRRLRPHLAWDLRDATRHVSARIDPRPQRLL